ncbi:MAG: hypothetical protein ACRDQU_13170 [Pseudonocardiaceae bacterium]
MSITNAAQPSTNAVFPLSIAGLSSVGYGCGAALLIYADRAAPAAYWDNVAAVFRGRCEAAGVLLDHAHQRHLHVGVSRGGGCGRTLHRRQRRGQPGLMLSRPGRGHRPEMGNRW